MAERILYGLVKDVLKNLGSRAFDEIALAWYLKDRLESLKNTINTIKNMLLDAEEKQADNLAVREWLERLAAAVYAADDLFDKIATLASRKQLMGGNKVIKEVHTFFSCSNQLVFTFSISQKIKSIREELDGIVNDGNQFKFISYLHVDRSVMSRNRVETMSFLDTERIIGRDGDKKAVLAMLLASSITGDQDVLPVIPIVGMGGIGKTALAQLLYNDPRIQLRFKLRLWVCVPDDFDIKVMIKKLLRSATGKDTPNLDLDQLQSILRKEIRDKKYLIVLDDVWNVDREDWIKVRDLLKISRKGTKILVTSRSRQVAKKMGNVPLYELQGLSDEKSWELFEKVAFEPRQAQEKPHLVKIGKEILKKCANVPLVIRTMGSLLYGEDDNKWLSFKDQSGGHYEQSQA